MSSVKTPNTQSLFFFTVAMALVFLASSTCHAHRVTIFAWVDGETVYTESKFGAGQKVQKGNVLVLDEAGNELLAGKTDSNGEFSFPVPQKKALKIVLNAGMGHQAEWFIPASEITDINPIPAGAEPVAADSAETEVAGAKDSATKIERIMEKVLDRKLKPLNRMLADMQQPGPSFRDIVGGIGYILGLMGIAAWFRYQKK